MSDLTVGEHRDSPEMPRHQHQQRPRAVQVLGIALTALVAMTASAALAWTLRGWHERPRPPDDAVASPNAPADRQAILRGAGRLAYQVHCARCHGAEGHGDGSDAERLRPPPRDFASHGWRSAPTPDNVRRAIVAGIAGTAMPGWGDSLSRLELDGLVAHVISLAPAPGRSVEAEDADEALSPTLTSLLGRAGFIAEATPKPAPPLTLRDLDGKPATLAERRGRPVLVLFWGTTCGHCLDEIPALDRLAERHRDRDLDVLPVCVDEPDAAIVRDVAGPQLGRRPLYLDPDGTARLRYDVQTLPTFALIDRSGRLIARTQGARDWTDPAIDDLIRQGLATDEVASNRR
jgi:mono/diheme cytochrome c family protein/peroxiredoxin